MGSEPSQVISIYLDDSGVLTIGDKSKFFVYGGYSFTSDKERLTAKSVYRKRVLEIKENVGVTTEGELKAANLRPKHKRALFEVLKR